MPVAGKRNQTSSLLTQAHREEERGQITDEHCGSKMGKKIKITNKEKIFTILLLLHSSISLLWRFHHCDCNIFLQSPCQLSTPC